MTALSQQLLNASPTYARARSLGVRLIPLAPSPDVNAEAWRGIARLLAGGVVFFLLLGFGLQLLWSL